MTDIDLLVIGGGPAAMAAAVSAHDNGIKNILLIERADRLGGILPQCIHPGFGLVYFKEDLTGPEYAARFVKLVSDAKINVKLNTMALRIEPGESALIATVSNKTDGAMRIKTRAVVLAMGCRERTRGAINIPGARPSGVMTAGTAQRFVNLEGYLPGNEIVVLGSGDIGLIMSRRMTLEGARVISVLEAMPYSGGLKRNIVQCLEDYDIPLKLSHTVVRIHGTRRIEGVTSAWVDKNFKPVAGTEEYIPCDMLMLSVGLIPENELSRKCGIILDAATGGPEVDDSMQTSVPGIFACGNVVHVHDLVDYATQESVLAGRRAAEYILGKCSVGGVISTIAGRGVRYIVPQRINAGAQSPVRLFYRVTDVMSNITATVKKDGEIIKKIKRRHAAPGEMETIDIETEFLQTTGTLSLELDSEREAAGGN